ncbi:AraC family transcriptional regulator [Intrasporangium sp. YIM S08009]|uniref:AraC family transcriptional regulator n=1 Tax=Intrasporangium zincisolvens TaxID=3080018 RepID=UPI002B05AB8A|nr:AraC family transcriptional regulator ligand-binding domain-containing protein [Intrasporangium sp. YIM S08009]
MTATRFSLDPGFKVFVSDLRISWHRVLRRAGLPDATAGRSAALLTPAEYFALWSALEAEAGDRDLAVDVGRAISPEAFSPPILAALASPDLAVAANRVATYKPLVGPLTLEVDRTTDTLVIRYVWPGDLTPPPLLTISELVFWVALARTATRHHVRPSRVMVPDLPRDVAGVEAYLGARVDRGREHAVTFSAIDARRPFLTENEMLWRVLAPDLRTRLADLDASATVAARVRSVLHETLAAGDPSIGAVTHRLATSPRTLQRQLRQEGTTYQSVLATTREHLARQYLARPELRPHDIAYLLGYDDTNSFFRAFRSWTGTTPEAARAAKAGSKVEGRPKIVVASDVVRHGVALTLTSVDGL